VRVRVERPRRLLLLAGVAFLVAAAGAVAVWAAASDQGEPKDLLPNLTQAAPDDLNGRTGGTAGNPRFFLGFQSAAANLGEGPLMVLGSRKSGQPTMKLRQQIRRSDGSTREVPLEFTMLYVRSPDHAHWHVLQFMRYELRAADSNRIVRDQKTGFCLGDRYVASLAVPGRPPRPLYRNRCGRGDTDRLSISEGISVGWGDNYEPHLEGQELELTSLPAGRYVLVHRVNTTRDIVESDYADNVASMAIDLSWPRGPKLPPSIDVVARCPGSATCS
jgi:Lysyl oxidase